MMETSIDDGLQRKVAEMELKPEGDTSTSEETCCELVALTIPECYVYQVERKCEVTCGPDS